MQCLSWLLVAQKGDFENLLLGLTTHSANQSGGDPCSSRIPDEEQWIAALQQEAWRTVSKAT
jgi:hypothetical protein